jgi:predicted secreted protein
MQYDEGANNQLATLKVNDAFEVVLPETRTAGYRWTLKISPEPTCTLLQDTVQPSPAAGGGSGTRSWRFRATSTGVCEIELHYTRPWESSSEPAKTFRLKVQVRS